MAKYKFETGGQDENVGLYNQLINQLYFKTSESEEAPQEEQVKPEEDSDFIKGLKEYDDEEKGTDQEIETRFKELEDKFNERLNSLYSAQQNIDYFSDSEGQDYLTQMYDTQNTSVPYNSNSFSLNRNNRPLEEIKQKQMLAESAGNPNAVSHAGAKGLYQFMDATWEQYKPSAEASPFDPKASEKARDKYMTHLSSLFGGNQRMALAAYNWGEGNVQKAIKEHGNEWERYIPKETKGYLKKILDK